MEEAYDLVEMIVSRLQKGLRCVMHCRGGMGRAGMLAACVLLRIGECVSAAEAIATVRKRRGKGAVESRAQEAFVSRYLKDMLGRLESMTKAACEDAVE